MTYKGIDRLVYTHDGFRCSNIAAAPGGFMSDMTSRYTIDEDENIH